MTDRVFATKWDFVYGQVMFGVHAQSDQLLLGSENGVDPLWVCWTDKGLAEHQLMSGYVLKQAPVRQVLPALPAGTAIRVDPGLPRGLALDAGMLAELQELCAPFPAGHSVDLGTIDALPKALTATLRQVTQDHTFVHRLWLVRYRVDDGPAQGLAVYETDVGREAQESAVSAIVASLDAAGRSTVMDELAGVQVLALEDLPEGVRAWVEDQRPLATSG